jgi:hypothetical protein
MPSFFYRIGIDMQNVIVIALVILIALFIVHQYNPRLLSFMSLSEGFADPKAGGSAPPAPVAPAPAAPTQEAKKEEKSKFEDYGKDEGFSDLSAYQGPAGMASAEAPAGCYPRDQLTPSELLPKDMASIWAEQNPMGPGSLKGKNFLSAGALIGVNTVGQSMRNANLQVRSEPPNPQVAVSIFNQSTISPDFSHRPLEIGS